jgi:two-component system, OmpR family, sensor histidine kinase KdpD
VSSGQISHEMALVNTLGHDLRSPLTAVRGAATLLLQALDEIPPDKVRDLLTIIDRRVIEMSDRIEDIIAVCHLDAGDLTVYLEPVKAGVIVRRATDPERPWSRPVAAPDVPAGLVVEADLERSVQVLRALISNALRYSPPDSPVRLEVESKGGAVEFHVIDAGPGIPSGLREQAFERLSYGDGGGPGLGLYLARGLAHAMGGEVSASPAPDGGAKLSFRLNQGG